MSLSPCSWLLEQWYGGHYVAATPLAWATTPWIILSGSDL